MGPQMGRLFLQWRARHTRRRAGRALNRAFYFRELADWLNEKADRLQAKADRLERECGE